MMANPPTPQDSRALLHELLRRMTGIRQDLATLSLHISAMSQVVDNAREELEEALNR